MVRIKTVWRSFPSKLQDRIWS